MLLCSPGQTLIGSCVLRRALLGEGVLVLGPAGPSTNTSSTHSGLRAERRSSLPDIHHSRLDQRTGNGERDVKKGAEKDFEKNLLGGQGI